MESEQYQNDKPDIKTANNQEITLNGEKHAIPENCRLDVLLHENGITQTLGVAVAVNFQVIPKAKWAETTLNDGDKITVIKATQGG